MKTLLVTLVVLFALYLIIRYVVIKMVASYIKRRVGRVVRDHINTERIVGGVSKFITDVRDEQRKIGGETMKHRPYPGMCPFYDAAASKCLATSSETTQTSGTRDSKCMSSSNWKTCGNAEAYRRGEHKGSPRL